jgi:hypothetical protein
MTPGQANGIDSLDVDDCPWVFAIALKRAQTHYSGIVLPEDTVAHIEDHFGEIVNVRLGDGQSIEHARL